MVENASARYNLDPELLEGPLSQEERALRDMFVVEYLRDYDPYQACLRLGFKQPFAAEWCKKLMAEPYVHRGIANGIRALKVDSEEEIENDRALIVNGLRQAAQNGPYASRVAAMRELSEMRGFRKKPGENESENLVELFRKFAMQAPV